MLEDLTKKWIREHVTKFLKPEHKEECVELVDLFEKSLELAEMNETIDGFSDYEKILIDMREGNDSVKKRAFYSFQKFEQYMKLILFIAKPAKFQELKNIDRFTFVPVAIELGIRDYVRDLSGYKDIIMIKKNTSENVNSRSIQYVNDIEEMIKRIRDNDYGTYYNLVNEIRNNTSHNYEKMNEDVILFYQRMVLSMYILLVRQYKSAINDAFNRKSIEKYLDGQAYCSKIISNYQTKQNDGYTYIEVKWAQRQDKPDNDEYTVKQGSILVLRDDLLASGEKNIKLIGEAGLGKTSAIDYMEYQDALKYISEFKNNQIAKIPVVIHMIDALPGQTILNLISNKLNITIEICRICLEYNAFYLYLDGFNEILDIKLRQSMSRELDELTDRYKETLILISDRDTKGYVSVGDDYSNCELLPWNTEDIKQFIEKNKRIKDILIDETTVKLIRNHLVTDETYYENINPLKLCEIIFITNQKKMIPKKEELDEEYINAVMDRERREKKDLTVDTLEKYLMALAILDSETDENGDVFYYEPQILSCFSKFKEKYGLTESVDTRIALRLALQLGILVMEGEVYRFAKESFRIIFWLRAEKEKYLAY